MAMTLRLNKSHTASQVLRRASDRGVGITTIAEATGLNQHEIHERLFGVGSFTVSELVQVGGLLSVSPADLMEETP